MKSPQFQSGDNALIHITKKVKIRKANGGWYGQHNCKKCGSIIPDGKLHGVSSDNYHYCLKCCEKD